MPADWLGCDSPRPELEHAVSYTVLALIGMLAGFLVGYVIGHQPARTTNIPPSVPHPRSLQSDAAPAR